MLKSNVEKPAKPGSIFIMYGILKGYVNYPSIIVVRSLINSRCIRNTLNRNLPDDVKQILSMTLGIYLILMEYLDRETALALVKVIIIPMGLINQMALFRYVEEPNHTMENLIHQAKRFKAEGPMRVNKYSINAQTENRYSFSVHNCVFLRPFADNGCPELSAIYCSVDHAVYNLYSPGKIVFSRGGRSRIIAEGNTSCDFICEAIA
jgi:hypothetical protein